MWRGDAGVVVVQDNSYKGMEDFTRIQRCTVARQGIDPMPPNYFHALLTELGPRRAVSLYFAEYRGKRLATALIVRFGRRATYFFGGSLVQHRRVMAPSLLHFEMIEPGKSIGMRVV